MLTALLLLTALQQTGDPGWNKPIWRADAPQGWRDYFIYGADVTGDGIPEIVIRDPYGYMRAHVIDGASGETWFSTNRWDYIPPPFKCDWIDLDGDGIKEFILSNTYDNSNAGHLMVVHGGDGNLLWEAKGRKQNDRLGETLLFPDLDGDAIPDVLAVGLNKGKLFAISGKSGTILWDYNQKSHNHCSLVPDLDGDNIQDIFIGGRGRALALSGQSGQVLWRELLPDMSDGSSWEVLHADLNADGISDIIIGDSLAQYHGIFESGIVQAIDGSNGASLWRTGGMGRDFLGTDLRAEDLNHDGVMDFLSLNPSRLTAVNGLSGATIWREIIDRAPESPPLELFDTNRDGVRDIILANDHSGANTINGLRCMNGSNGATLWQATAPGNGNNFKNLTISDLNTDGVPDVLASSPFATSTLNEQGMIRAISGETGLDIWTAWGLQENHHLGNHVNLTNADGGVGMDVISETKYGTSSYGLHALDGQTGILLWSRQNSEESYIWHYQLADFDGDNRDDLLQLEEIENPYDDSRISVLDTTTGEDIWSVVFPSNDFGFIYY